MMNNEILKGHKELAEKWLEELNPQEGEVIYEGSPAGECAKELGVLENWGTVVGRILETNESK